MEAEGQKFKVSLDYIPSLRPALGYMKSSLYVSKTSDLAIIFRFHTVGCVGDNLIYVVSDNRLIMILAR